MRVVQLALEDPEFQLVCATERPGYSSLGKDIGVLAGKDQIGVALSAQRDIDKLLRASSSWDRPGR